MNCNAGIENFASAGRFCCICLPSSAAKLNGLMEYTIYAGNGLTLLGRCVKYTNTYVFRLEHVLTMWYVTLYGWYPLVCQGVLA